MRRSDREVTDILEILQIIEKCDVCRLGLSHNNIPYVVPMNYGYEYIDDKLTLYFHGAKEGKKLEIIGGNPIACFEMDCSHRLIEAKAACGFTMEFESVIGYGKICVCDKNDEKIHALELLMKTYAKDRTFDIPEAALKSITVFRLDVSELTGKRLIREPR